MTPTGDNTRRAPVAAPRVGSALDQIVCEIGAGDEIMKLFTIGGLKVSVWCVQRLSNNLGLLGRVSEVVEIRRLRNLRVN